MNLTGQFSRVRIRALAAAVPETRVDNAAFEPRLGQDGIRKFEKMTGIRSRCHVRKLTTSDLAESAVRLLQEKGDWRPEETEACLFVSQTPDCMLPATACILHGRLGLPKACLAMDIGMGCSGFLYGLYTAAAFVESGSVRRVLLLGGDCISKVAAPDDVSNQMLFGDAGFAVVLERTEEPRALPYLFGTNGVGAGTIFARGGGTLSHLALVDATDTPWLQMDGLEVFNFTINVIPEAIAEFMRVHGMNLDVFDRYCFHQANRMILKQVAMVAGFRNSSHLISIDRYGNTSSASIPLTLCDASEQPVGMTLLAGFGVGLSWGLAAYDFSDVKRYPVCVAKEAADA